MDPAHDGPQSAGKWPDLFLRFLPRSLNKPSACATVQYGGIHNTTFLWFCVAILTALLGPILVLRMSFRNTEGGESGAHFLFGSAHWKEGAPT